MTNAQSAAADSVMSRVMKLLNLANDESATAAERALAEEHAERLMTQHMIDRFEAEQAAKNAGHVGLRKPIKDEWSVPFAEHKAEGVDDHWEFSNQIVDMMNYVLEHCNVRVNKYGYKYDYKTKARIFQIVGFQEDIAYAERIWFNVFKTFVSNVNPAWDTNKSLGWNAYTFASAGVPWKQMVLMAEKAGDTRLEWPQRFQNVDPSKPFYTRYSFQTNQIVERHTDNNNKWNPPLDRSIKKLRKLVKQYCEDNQVSYPYAAGSKLRVATRNSFARSYRSTIQARLTQIREEATMQHAGEATVNADKFALAVKDTRERVDEEFYRLFPEYDPEVQKRKQEERERLIKEDWDALSPEEQKKRLRDQAREQAKWARKAAKARTSYRAIREDPADRYDAAAWSRGKKAAESVNLRADDEVKQPTRKAVE